MGPVDFGGLFRVGVAIGIAFGGLIAIVCLIAWRILSHVHLSLS